jgi:hypothetical protein
MPITYEELSGSGRTQHDADSANGGDRLFLVGWSDRLAFAATLSGKQWPGIPYCFCRNIQIDLFSRQLCPDAATLTDPNSTLVSYSQNGGMVALVRATYGTDYSTAPWPCQVPKPSHTEGTQLKLRIRSSGQFLTVPADATTWSDNTEAYPEGPLPTPDTNARITIPIVEYHIEWLYVDEPPLNEWDELLGCVNAGEFLGAEAETILFEGYESDQSTQFVIADPFCWKLVPVFRKRRIVVGENVYGWNHELRNDGWTKIKMSDGDGGQVDRYSTADFSTMFTEADCEEEPSPSSSGV